jgi:hypothetical protein
LLGVPTPPDGAWISTADADANGTLDLFVIRDGYVTIWDIDPSTGASTVQRSIPLPFGGSGQFTVGDFDLDNLPDLWTIEGGEVKIALASDDFATVVHTERLLSLPTNIVDVIASDYDGDGRKDIVVFDGSSKMVWLGNTPMPDGHPPEVWFVDEEPDCEEDQPQAARASLDEFRFASSGWVAEGSYKWRKAHGMTVGCDPEDEDCDTPISTHAMVAEFFSWIDGLEPVPGDPDLAAARAVARAGYATSCPVQDAGCWAENIPAAELSARFGIFLADRRGEDVNPHRWIIPVADRLHMGSIPH